VEYLRLAVSDSGREQVRQQRISAGFHVHLIDEGMHLFNYSDNSAGNFLSRPVRFSDVDELTRSEVREFAMEHERRVRLRDRHSGRQFDTAAILEGVRVRLGYRHLDGIFEEMQYASKARMRREYRGLVVHSSGAIMARPLHKFFSVDQVPETEMRQLEHKQIELITRKLDGQMVYGVVVAGEVQFWTRSGPTEVGIEAYRVALADAADFLGLVIYASGQQCTAVFEYIGRRSLKKAFEGHMPRLVLLAVRHHNSGIYWGYTDMLNVARRFGVDVVERLPTLERAASGDDDIGPLSVVFGIVKGWHNCEGVVVRFTDQTWVKIKSDWWLKTGYSSQFSTRISAVVADERVKLRIKKEKLQHFSVRLAVTDLDFDTRPVEVMEWFPGCLQVQMVYGHSGRLRVAIVAFATESKRNEALWDPANSDLRLEPAYSHRARTCARHRVNTFNYVGRPLRGSSSSP